MVGRTILTFKYMYDVCANEQKDSQTLCRVAARLFDYTSLFLTFYSKDKHRMDGLGPLNEFAKAAMLGHSSSFAGSNPTIPSPLPRPHPHPHQSTPSSAGVAMAATAPVGPNPNVDDVYSSIAAMEVVFEDNEVDLQDEIIGNEPAKQALEQAIKLPVMLKDLARKYGVGDSAILLYGQPGTGKTRLAETAARQSCFAFFKVDVSDLMSKWVGESERYVICPDVLGPVEVVMLVLTSVQCHQGLIQGSHGKGTFNHLH